MYDRQKRFTDFEREIGQAGRMVIEVLTRGEEMFKDLAAYRGVKTNQDIADELGVDVTWVDDLEMAVIAMHRLWQAGDGQTVADGDYFDNLRMFT
jgi:hypothetical protein